MLLFANYKTVVEKAGSAPNAKNKGQRRAAGSLHQPPPLLGCQNRFGLPEELPFEYASIAACIPDPHPGAAPAPRPIMVEDAPAPKPAPVPVPAAPAAPPAVPAGISASALQAQGVPTALAQLMAANNVTPEELRPWSASAGTSPPICRSRITRLISSAAACGRLAPGAGDDLHQPRCTILTNFNTKEIYPWLNI